MSITGRFAVAIIGIIAAASIAATTRAQAPSASPSPSLSDLEDEASEKVGYASPDGRFAFLLRADAEPSIDLIDATTEKVLQRIDEGTFRSISYSVAWSPDSKRFALMTRAGHPNQGVTVYFRRGNKFKEVDIPELLAEIPKKVLAGKEHSHVSTNHWQQVEKWNGDGSLLLTIDHTVDGVGHTASAVRTVLLGFDRSGTAKILKSRIKYSSKNSDEE